jgi:hypothetical protein
MGASVRPGRTDAPIDMACPAPADRPHASFRAHARDLYVPPGELGFWPGALRDPADPVLDRARAYCLHAGYADILVNCTGLPYVAPLHESPPDKFRQPAERAAASAVPPA